MGYLVDPANLVCRQKGP